MTAVVEVMMELVAVTGGHIEHGGENYTLLRKPGIPGEGRKGRYARPSD